MDTIPSEEIVKEAKKKIAPLRNKEMAIKEKLTKNIAITTTVITVFAYVVLYAYKKGYCGYFNIPDDCIRIDLKNYMPALLQVSGIALYIIWYIIFLKIDIAYRRAKFQPMRVCYGFLIIYMFFSMNGILRHIPGTTYLIIVLSIAIGIELFVWCLLKLTRLERSPVNEKNKNMAIEDAVTDLLLYHTVAYKGTFILLIAVLLAPSFGKLIAKNTTDFQTFLRDEKEFAVIIDYGDKVIAQETCAISDELVIDTDNYTYFAKEGVTFEYKKYDRVSLNYATNEPVTESTTTQEQ